MIPIHDTQFRATTPYVTRALIAINVLVFLFMLTLDTQPSAFVLIRDSEFAARGQESTSVPSDVSYWISDRDEFVLRYGAVPEFVTGYLDGDDTSHDVVESRRFLPNELGWFVPVEGRGINLLDGFLLLLTPLTAMFLHGGWIHLIGNMLFLWVFGDNVEDRIGHVRFALFYGLGGYLATAAHIFFDTSDLVPVIGASGAISAVLGAYLLLFPRAMVQVLIPIVFLIPLVVPAPLMIGFWFLINLVNGIGSFASDSVGSGGTAWFAHLGGFAAGMLLLYPMLIGRWRAPATAVGPTWNLPPGAGRFFRPRNRPRTDLAVSDVESLEETSRRTGVVIDIRSRAITRPGSLPRPRRRRWLRWFRRRRRGDIDPYRDFDSR